MGDRYDVCWINSFDIFRSSAAGQILRERPRTRPHCRLGPFFACSRASRRHNCHSRYVVRFPVSTTHALIGAILGSGLIAAGAEVRLESLGKGFLLPLLLSPMLALVVAGPLYLLLRFLRLQFGISKSGVSAQEKFSRLSRYLSWRQS